MYTSALKELLGVRVQTCNDLVHLESGIPPLSTTIKSIQNRFFTNIIQHPSGSPISKAIAIAKSGNTKANKIIDLCLESYSNIVTVDMENIRMRVIQSETSRRVTYRSLNPNLSVHSIYGSANKLPEYLRKAITRVRLGSHRLKIETGRWSRIPVDQRLCSCGLAIQSEEHVLLTCNLTNKLRKKTYSNLNELMKDDPLTIGLLCYNSLKMFE
jgi:hypothetical protein